MYDSRTRLAHDVVQEVTGYFKEKVFRTIIPRNVRLERGPVLRQADQPVRSRVHRRPQLPEARRGGAPQCLSRALGKGIDALLGEDDDGRTPPPRPRCRSPPCSPTPQQPRQEFNDASLRGARGFHPARRACCSPSWSEADGGRRLHHRGRRTARARGAAGGPGQDPRASCASSPRRRSSRSRSSRTCSARTSRPIEEAQAYRRLMELARPEPGAGGRRRSARTARPWPTACAC